MTNTDIKNADGIVLSKDQIVHLLSCDESERQGLFKESAAVREKFVGNSVYLRGLIEFSNICAKDCLYCGIRKSNTQVERYELTDEEIIRAAEYAAEKQYGSIVLQSGERKGQSFTKRLTNILQEIHRRTQNQLRVTLSCGEQNQNVYREWKEAGAHRYLLRIETSNSVLYEHIHPKDTHHSFSERVRCLNNLREVGYQVGTGIMLGLPGQSNEDIARDLLWIVEKDVDMIGLGPYLLHHDTPLKNQADNLWPEGDRFQKTLIAIACLRLMMPSINIAASTAMQSIHPQGREMAIKVGANVFMPNITPGIYRDSYKLYDDKPCTREDVSDCEICVVSRILATGMTTEYGKWGDSLHFFQRNS